LIGPDRKQEIRETVIKNPTVHVKDNGQTIASLINRSEHAARKIIIMILHRLIVLIHYMFPLTGERPRIVSNAEASIIDVSNSTLPNMRLHNDSTTKNMRRLLLHYTPPSLLHLLIPQTISNMLGCRVFVTQSTTHQKNKQKIIEYVPQGNGKTTFQVVLNEKLNTIIDSGPSVSILGGKPQTVPVLDAVRAFLETKKSNSTVKISPLIRHRPNGFSLAHRMKHLNTGVPSPGDTVTLLIRGSYKKKYQGVITSVDTVTYAPHPVFTLDVNIRSNIVPKTSLDEDILDMRLGNQDLWYTTKVRNTNILHPWFQPGDKITVLTASNSDNMNKITKQPRGSFPLQMIKTRVETSDIHDMSFTVRVNRKRYRIRIKDDTLSSPYFYQIEKGHRHRKVERRLSDSQPFWAKIVNQNSY
jgi:hypothetical protein